MSRLMCLNLQFFPSTAPLLQGRVRPLRTAAWSRRMPRGKEGRAGWAAAVAAGEHFRELGDVAGEGVEVGAPGAGAGELAPGVVVEAVRAGEDPAGDVAGFGRGGGCGRERGCLAEGLQVGGGAGVAAAVAAV